MKFSIKNILYYRNLGSILLVLLICSSFLVGMLKDVALGGKILGSSLACFTLGSIIAGVVFWRRIRQMWWWGAFGKGEFEEINVCTVLRSK